MGDRTGNWTRLSDVLVEDELSRFGNDGASLLKEFFGRLNSLFGFPLEIVPQNPASDVLEIGPGMYELPDGQRASWYDDAAVSEGVSGLIDFGAGTISVGGVSGFSMPTMTAGYYVKALVQYAIKEHEIDVTFGSEGATLLAATVPQLKDRFEPVYMVELHSPGGGVGNWDSITKQSLVKIWKVRGSKAPKNELQTVTGSPQTVFTLTQITIPSNRNRLFVMVNGVGAQSTEYTVTGDQEVTFMSAKPIGAEVRFIVV